MMKRILTLLTAVLLTATVFGQSPEKMSYQAVIRNASNELVKSQAVGMQISILQGTADGTAVYVETQTPTTNANGLITVEIGAGTTTDDFSTIDWSNGTYFVKTETDPAGGTNYTITGTSQLLSVPYALHAKTAETITGTVTETDPAFTAWDKTTGVTITESQVSDLKSYLTSYTETDPAYTASSAASITAADITKLGNLSGTNTGDQNISGIATNATAITGNTANITTNTTAITANTTSITNNETGIAANTTAITNIDLSGIAANTTAITNIDLSGITTNTASITNNETGIVANTTAIANIDLSGIAANTASIVTNETAIAANKRTHYVGELYGGGVVFWVDHTGDHGLVCSMVDISTSMAWSNVTATEIGAAAQSDWNGLSNTAAIVIQGSATSGAAFECNGYENNNYGTGVFIDWYLPSIGELNDLWNNFKAVQKALDSDANPATTPIVKDYYWSSSEYNNAYAWTFYFGNGYPESNDKDATYYVRAVRAF